MVAHNIYSKKNIRQKMPFETAFLGNWRFYFLFYPIFFSSFINFLRKKIFFNWF